MRSEAAAPEIRGWCPGALRPMPSGDGWLVRIRPPGGVLTPAQAAGIARAARAHGNGVLDLSQRANLQLRGVRPEAHAALIDAWQLQHHAIEWRAHGKTVTMMHDTVYIRRIDTVKVAGPAAKPIVIGAVNFAFNKSDISPEAKTVLDVIAASLVEPTNSSRTITVTGNTDAIGSERYNEKLGQDRADQAKAYLVSKGVAESRIVARTQGEKDPIAPNTTDNGRATNRRVLVMLTN